MNTVRNLLLSVSLVVLFATSATAAIGSNYNFENVYPGTMCNPDFSDSNADYYADGSVRNTGNAYREFACPLVSEVKQLSRTTSCGNDCLTIDDYIVPSPLDEVHVRVYDGNDNATNSAVQCELERRYFTRSTGATGFDEDDQDTTTTIGTGYSTLRMLISNTTVSSSTTYFSSVHCKLPATDVNDSLISGYLAEYDGT